MSDRAAPRRRVTGSLDACRLRHPVMAPCRSRPRDLQRVSVDPGAAVEQSRSRVVHRPHLDVQLVARTGSRRAHHAALTDPRDGPCSSTASASIAKSVWSVVVMYVELWK